MFEQSGRWDRFGERVLHDAPWVQLVLADVRSPGGDRFEHYVVRMRRVAVALTVNEAEEVLMLWRYRFATEQWGYEMPGGIVEEGEEAAATAAREAAEECGYAPVGEPVKLLSFEPLPGMVTAPMDVYLWREAQKVGEPSDPEEAGVVEWVPLSRVLELAERGELLGSGTLVALMYYLASRARETDTAGQDNPAQPT